MENYESLSLIPVLGAPVSMPSQPTYLNKIVLMEVVRVLESPKVQEKELAQQVKAMISELPEVYNKYLHRQHYLAKVTKSRYKP